MRREAIVIGSGVGGLASAIRLAKLGFKVKVFEKNDFLGGKVHSRTFGGYRFDIGPSVFTEPHLIDELHKLVDTPTSFRYIHLKESFRYFFNDGKKAILTSGIEDVVTSFAEEFNENPKKVRKLLHRVAKNYDALYPVFITTSLHRFRHGIKPELIKAILRIPMYGLVTTMDGFVKRFLKNEKSIQIFNRFATYNGSSPFKTPGLLSIISHLELNAGIYFPVGGMVSITEGLVQTAKKLGVAFYCEDAVEEIIVENDKVVGVQSHSGKYPADLVVSNMDVHFTYERLLGERFSPNRLLNQEMSSSAVVFYWGIKKQFDTLGLHNIFFTSDYKQEFKAIFEDKTLVDDPTVYIHISSKIEKSDATEGGENWFVMVNAPINTDQNWDELVHVLRKNILRKISRILEIDVEQYIEAEYINDPVKLATVFNGKGGSIYGNSSNSKWSAFYRHPNQAPKLKNLYFAGVTVHPGGGIPLALNAAKIVERMVKEDFNFS
jgi:phytoene desaturase